MEEKKKHAIELRKNMTEKAKQDKINAFKRQYGDKNGKKNRAPAN